MEDQFAKEAGEMSKRILFVDDDSHVLDGYRRLFRSMRKEWQMTFCSSGAEALELIRRQPFEVLVTDLQMPGVDGLELLAKVIDINPGIARIVLTGFSNAAASMEVAEYAHQCLSKPCDIEHLKEAIEHSCYIQSLIGSEDLKRAIGGISRLPSTPTVYHRLSQELIRETATSASVAAIIEQDIGLAAKILQLVNSAFFGLPRQIASLEQAVSLLGVRQVRDVVLAAHVFEAYPELPGEAGFSFDGLRQQSLLVARLARRIAIDMGNDSELAEQAFLGGLLHDFGILVLASNWPEKYAQMLVKAREKNAPLSLAEKAYLKMTHAEAGAYILGLWKIPPAVVAAVLTHHNPIIGERRNNVIEVAVHVADGLVDECGFGMTGHIGGRLDSKLIASMGLEPQLDRWRGWVAEVAEEAGEVVS